jgi:hypothetical protein
MEASASIATPHLQAHAMFAKQRNRPRPTEMHTAEAAATANFWYIKSPPIQNGRSRAQRCRWRVLPGGYGAPDS